MSWRVLNASVAGTSHLQNGLPCQDDCFVEIVSRSGRHALVAIASDGAGSARCAEEGSGLTCELLFAAAEAWLASGGAAESLTIDAVEQWLCGVRTAIGARAAETELSLRDFACTVVAALVDETAAAFLQIGDGAIVTGRGGSYDVVFWPAAGEFTNMTFFLTDDDWTKHLCFETRTETFDDLALMTDGLQRLALQFDTRAAHAPFFAPLFAALERGETGYAAGLEPELVAFLGSTAVNERTDDDKSLILATRREPGAERGDL